VVCDLLPYQHILSWLEIWHEGQQADVEEPLQITKTISAGAGLNSAELFPPSA